MKQVAIAFFLALAVGAVIGLVIAGPMSQAGRVRLMVAGSVVLALLLGGVIVWINYRER